MILIPLQETVADLKDSEDYKKAEEILKQHKI